MTKSFCDRCGELINLHKTHQNCTFLVVEPKRNDSDGQWSIKAEVTHRTNGLPAMLCNYCFTELVKKANEAMGSEVKY